MELKVRGPCHVKSGDLTGEAFTPSYSNITIMPLDEGQELDLTVHFDCQPSIKHARYSPLAAVGMKKVDGEGRHCISFEVNDPEMDPLSLMEEAFTRLEERVDSALLQLSRQGSSPPKTMC